MSKLRWRPFAALGAVAAILGVMVAGGQAEGQQMQRDEQDIDDDDAEPGQRAGTNREQDQDGFPHVGLCWSLS